jgi:hypothetical protein
MCRILGGRPPGSRGRNSEGRIARASRTSAISHEGCIGRPGRRLAHGAPPDADNGGLSGVSSKLGRHRGHPRLHRLRHWCGRWDAVFALVLGERRADYRVLAARHPWVRRHLDGHRANQKANRPDSGDHQEEERMISSEESRGRRHSASHQARQSCISLMSCEYLNGFAIVRVAPSVSAIAR